MIHRQSVRNAAFAALLALAATASAAQSYPARSVKLIVPSPPGGITDLLAREFGQRLSGDWGQPVLVENRPGAAQIIGTEAVAKSPADGYTLLVADGSVLAINPHLYSKLPFDALRDLSPVAVLCQISPVIAVSAALPVTSVRELIALAKAKPGSLSYGSFGSGTYAHISMEQFKKLADVSMLHVPYKGSAPAMTDLLSGQIGVILVNISVVEPYEKAGKVRILAAATPKRLALRPDLPTIAEAALPGFETGTWFGLLGPAHLPKDIVGKIHAEVAKVLADPEFRQQNLVKFGLEPVAMTPEQLGQTMEADLERWGRLVKESGAKID
jgi:tripartite-type tricarboxylate transporter receptor subunit TctC